MSLIVNKGYTGGLMQTYDFIVVGGASPGLDRVRTRSDRSCLSVRGGGADRFHATGRSAALFAPTYGGKAIRAVTRASRAFFDQPPRGFVSILSCSRGVVSTSRALTSETVWRYDGAVRALGGRVTLVTDREASALVPLFREGYVAQAALTRTPWILMSRRSNKVSCAALAQRVPRSEAIAVSTRCRSRTGCGRLMSATGRSVLRCSSMPQAHGPMRLRSSVERIRLDWNLLRRTALLVDPPAGVDVRRWPAVIDADEMFYFKPDAGKLLVSPADETPDKPGDVQPDDLDVAVGVDRMQGALDIDVRRVSHSWAGLRTFFQIGLPW